MMQVYAETLEQMGESDRVASLAHKFKDEDLSNPKEVIEETIKHMVVKRNLNAWDSTVRELQLHPETAAYHKDRCTLLQRDHIEYCLR